MRADHLASLAPEVAYGIHGKAPPHPIARLAGHEMFSAFSGKSNTILFLGGSRPRTRISTRPNEFSSLHDPARGISGIGRATGIFSDQKADLYHCIAALPGIAQVNAPSDVSAMSCHSA